MKNKYYFLFIFLFTLLFLNCSQDIHEHTFSTDWSYNEIYHWHRATCEHTDEISDKSEHIFNKEELFKDEKTGIEYKKKMCTICDYEILTPLEKSDSKYDNKTPINSDEDNDISNKNQDNSDNNGDDESNTPTNPDDDTNNNQDDSNNNNNDEPDVPYEGYYIKNNILYIDFFDNLDLSTFYLVMPESGEVILTEKCTTIPKKAFNSVISKIKKLSIMGSIKSIPQYCFSSSNLETVIFNSDLEEIEDCAFINCSKMSGELVIPASVKIIGEGAFSGCKNISKLNISNGLEKIYAGAFIRCEEICNELIIPDSVRIIEFGAFSYCTKLKKVIIGDNLEEFGGAFLDSGVEELIIGDSIEKNIYNSGNSSFYAAPFNNLKKVTINLTNSTRIGNSMFRDNQELNEIYINTDCQNITIDDYAFYNCESLQQFPFDIVETIGNYAFYNSGFSELDLHSSNIGNNAFSNCKKLVNILLNSGVEYVGKEAFAELHWFYTTIDGIQSISSGDYHIDLFVSDTVKEFGIYAFSCSGNLYIKFEKDCTWTSTHDNFKYPIFSNKEYILYVDSTQMENYNSEDAAPIFVLINCSSAVKD